MKIGIIIPSTSHKRDWESFNDTYLVKHTLKTFFITYNQEHNYTFYIGIDKEDRIYDNSEIQSSILRLVSVIKNVNLEFIYMSDIPKGHLTKMWNKLFDKAYDDDCDYFFQCGDDIVFTTKNWINDCIEVLQKNNNIGIAGPINNNPRILTQSFVSRKHKELFNYYFPPELINWFCDDWINEVYRKLNAFFPLKEHYCNNVGGKPRYDIHNIKNFEDNLRNNWITIRKLCNTIVERDAKKAHMIVM
jgi:hypothetical protein|tara:strand:- start:2638 stop:3375 length:738 start_codon:yes stop_codon:yes gene_type:complete